MQQVFLRNQLLGNYSNKMFRDRMRVNKETFLFLYETLGPSIKDFDTPMTTSVDVESIVVVILARLATSNTLYMIGDLYGIVESTISVIIRECCKAIKDQLLLIVIEKLTSEKMKTISIEFEEIKCIPYVIGAINDFHIPIVASGKDTLEYYCRKGFYLVFLQGVLDA
jgi:hypothetical protein